MKFGLSDSGGNTVHVEGRAPFPPLHSESRSWQ